MSMNGSLAINWFGKIVRPLIAMIVRHPYITTQEYTTGKRHVHTATGIKEDWSKRNQYYVIT